MKKYTIISNDYKNSLEEKEKLNTKLIENGFTLDDEKPQIIFVIGGDGTFLKSVREYNSILNEAVFIPFNSGGIGFYTNHNKAENIDEVITALKQKELMTKEFELLELQNGDEVIYAANEIKILNEITPLYIDININDKFLERFHGTGLVFSTSNGSTGYMKAAGGAVIYPKNNSLFQMQELVPVSTNKYRSLNSSLIFSKEQVITLGGEVKNEDIIVDTKMYTPNSPKLTIKMSETTVKVLSLHKDVMCDVTILRDMFIKDKD